MNFRLSLVLLMAVNLMNSRHSMETRSSQVNVFSLIIFVFEFRIDFLLPLYWISSFAFQVLHGYLATLWELLAITVCCSQNLQRRCASPDHSDFSCIKLMRIMSFALQTFPHLTSVANATSGAAHCVWKLRKKSIVKQFT